MERYSGQSKSDVDYIMDPVLEKWLKTAPKWQQVQYDTQLQLKYLLQLAYKFGLYDAAEVVKKLIRE